MEQRANQLFQQQNAALTDTISTQRDHKHWPNSGSPDGPATSKATGDPP